jgi:hypothetical protein
MLKAKEDKQMKDSSIFKQLLNQDLETFLTNIVNKGVNRFNNFYEEISHIDYNTSRTNKDNINHDEEKNEEEENNDSDYEKPEEKLMEKFKVIENKLISCMSVKNNDSNFFNFNAENNTESEEIENKLKNSIDLEREHYNLNKELQNRFKILNCMINKDNLNTDIANKNFLDRKNSDDYFKTNENLNNLKISTNSFSGKSISNKQKLKPITSTEKSNSNSLYSSTSLALTQKSKIDRKDLASQTFRNKLISEKLEKLADSKNNKIALKSNKTIIKIRSLSNKPTNIVTSLKNGVDNTREDIKGKILNEDNSKKEIRKTSVLNKNLSTKPQTIKIPLFNQTGKFSLVKLQEKREERKQKLEVNKQKNDLYNFKFKYNEENIDFIDHIAAINSGNMNKEENIKNKNLD